MKNSLHYIIATLIFTIFSLSTNAQTKSHEVGIRISSFDSFGAIYKKRLKNDKLLRITSAAGAVSNAIRNDESRTNTNFALTIGLEKYKQLNENLNYYHGPEASGSLGFFFADNNSSSVNLGLGYIFGLQYDINEDFYISMETIPSILILIPIDGSEPRNLRINTSMNFAPNRVSLAIVHRFDLKK